MLEFQLPSRDNNDGMDFEEPCNVCLKRILRQWGHPTVASRPVARSKAFVRAVRLDSQTYRVSNCIYKSPPSLKINDLNDDTC